MSLAACAWPLARSSDAIAALARASGLTLRAVELAESADVERAAAWLGIEAEAMDVEYAKLGDALLGMAPALLRLPQGGWLALFRGDRRGVSVVGPDLAIRRLSLGAVRSALAAPIEEPVAAEVDALLAAVNVSPARRDRARRAILRKRLAALRIPDCWTLRHAPGTSFWRQLARISVGARVGVLLLAHVARYALVVLGWWMVGRGALDGRLDRGWLLAWALVLFSQLPFAALTTWAQGRVAIDIGALLKQRLLAGALLLAPDEIRTAGAGELLGRVHESEAVESLALSGGFTGLVAVLELVVAAIVLAFGAGAVLEVPLLVAWVAVMGAIGYRYYAHRARWTDARVEMTHALVERMVGHRTRLAQQAPERWHDGEDEAIDRYLELSRKMDAKAAVLEAVLPRGWVVVALLGLAPSFVLGDASTSSLAIAVGGALLAFRALRKLASGVASLVGAAIAWERIAALFRAATRTEEPVAPDLPLHAGPIERARPVVEASDVVFRYRDRGEPVLRGCSLRIHSGDRILLEGGSGGGKSTLAAVLSGLRAPESGLVLLGGLDRKTLGLEGWRRRVVSAPQFHENHVLASTFGFNLLMGRQWPPLEADIAEATAICDDLGLGPLLERMPAGMQQMVGETGWQLSHGEKSRLYIARALLQKADVVVLDESFAALDPRTLTRALECVLARADALVVIAHP